MAQNYKADKMNARPGKRARGEARRLTARQRRAEVLKLRIDGYTYPEIADVIGITPGRCNTIVKDELEKLDKKCQERREEVRQLEVQRLDGLFRTAYSIANSGGRGALTALERAVTIMERRSKLLGLDEPALSRAEISGPGGTPINMDLSKLTDEQLKTLETLSERAYQPAEDGPSSGETK